MNGRHIAGSDLGASCTWMIWERPGTDAEGGFRWDTAYCDAVGLGSR